MAEAKNVMSHDQTWFGPVAWKPSGFGTLRGAFLPQQLLGDALALERLMDTGPVR
jgi:hypothetical protein